jgi:transposase
MARMEIWTGRERRRSWSDEQKLQILREVASGLSVSVVARKYDMVPQQIYVWRRKLSGKTEANAGNSAPVFLPVAVVADREEQEIDRCNRASGKKSAKGTARLSRVKIRCKCGRGLTVESSIDPAVLRTLIRSVEEA